MKRLIKRGILLLLTLAVLVMCVACGGGATTSGGGGSGTTTTSGGDTKAAQTEEQTPPPGDNVESEPETPVDSDETEPSTPQSAPYAIDYDKWEASYNWNGQSTFSNTELIDGERGCIIENPVPNHAMMTQLVSVKPNMDYEFTVVFRVDGYQPGEENSGGACINIANPELTVRGGTPQYITSGDVWTSYCCVFNPGSATSVRLCLSNGWYGATSAGTAYFKAITLKERGTNEATPMFQ